MSTHPGGILMSLDGHVKRNFHIGSVYVAGLNFAIVLPKVMGLLSVNGKEYASEVNYVWRGRNALGWLRGATVRQLWAWEVRMPSPPTTCPPFGDLRDTTSHVRAAPGPFAAWG